MSVATKESAQNNLDKIDAAITKLSGNRAEMGALQNRLQSSINNMAIYNENLSAGNSRIRDVKDLHAIFIIRDISQIADDVRIVCTT